MINVVDVVDSIFGITKEVISKYKDTIIKITINETERLKGG
jgi:hypothetical protein